MKQLTDNIFVSGQIKPDDLKGFKEDGISVIINNRPDGEMFGQPTSEELAAEAEKLGLTYHHVPMAGQLDPDLITAMGEALRDMEGPVLAFCRSGTRSTYLWALTEAGKRPTEEIVSMAANAGYDIRNLVAILQNLANG